MLQFYWTVILFQYLKVKVNAIIKRASYKLQQEQTNEAIADFAYALELDPENCDVYYHRGQVSLTIDHIKFDTLNNLLLALIC